ncbi:MAG TPA: SGNH/GDSL hydrolase family protein [Acidimicrobiales bacterium]|nr:SGNH/GDSL hydrolase family protein [Acidimicrobiales bacterium]
MSVRPEQPEPFLRGCVFPAVTDCPYPRAQPASAEYLPADVWAAAQLPVGVRLEVVGGARTVRISYTTTRASLGYRGEAAGCAFVAYRAGQKVGTAEAEMGEGVAELVLSGRPELPVTIYLPEGMAPIVTSVEGVEERVVPAPWQPRWLAYGDAATQGWLASSPAMAWPAVAGRKLGLDVCNLGYAGTARGESTSALLLAETPAEVVSIAFGLNNWGRVPHTARLMAEEVRCFLSMVRQGHPGAPVVVVSPTVRPDAEETPNRVGATLGELRWAMEEAVLDQIAAGDDMTFLVRGLDLVAADDLADGVYPGDEGHLRIAAAVSKVLLPYLTDLHDAAEKRWANEGRPDMRELRDGDDVEDAAAGFFLGLKMPPPLLPGPETVTPAPELEGLDVIAPDPFPAAATIDDSWEGPFDDSPDVPVEVSIEVAIGMPLDDAPAALGDPALAETGLSVIDDPSWGEFLLAEEECRFDDSGFDGAVYDEVEPDGPVFDGGTRELLPFEGAVVETPDIDVAVLAPIAVDGFLDGTPYDDSMDGAPFDGDLGDAPFDGDLDREVGGIVASPFSLDGQLFDPSEFDADRTPPLVSDDPVSDDPVSDDPVCDDPVSDDPVSDDPEAAGEVVGADLLPAEVVDPPPVERGRNGTRATAVPTGTPSSNGSGTVDVAIADMVVKALSIATNGADDVFFSRPASAEALERSEAGKPQPF